MAKGKKTKKPLDKNTVKDKMNNMNEEDRDSSGPDVTEDVESEPEEQPDEQKEAKVADAPCSAEELLKQELSALNDKYLRLYSEFDNYRKRVNKERLVLIKTASEDIIVQLLPVLDDFDRAIQAMEDIEGVESLKTGISLIHQKLYKILELKGLKPIDAVNSTFDTDLHEAVTKIPATDESMKGKVVDQIEKGYTLNDKVIRFSKVVVGS